MTHDHLWVGVDLKIQAARTTLDEMRKALQPPVLVQESTGTIVGGPDWQSIFYPSSAGSSPKFEAFRGLSRLVLVMIEVRQ